MTDPFVAEIRILPFNFAPRGWAQCDGQLMPISQNTALFSLLGTNYGGDGKSTFGLPNLLGSMAMGAGDGIGLSPRVVGESGGEQSVTLLPTEMPVHTHGAAASANDGGDRSPVGNLFANDVGGVNMYAAPAGSVAMASAAVTPAGGSAPHNNMQPYLTVEFCIALQGIFPQRP